MGKKLTGIRINTQILKKTYKFSPLGKLPTQHGNPLNAMSEYDHQHLEEVNSHIFLAGSVQVICWENCLTTENEPWCPSSGKRENAPGRKSLGKKIHFQKSGLGTASFQHRGNKHEKKEIGQAGAKPNTIRRNIRGMAFGRLPTSYTGVVEFGGKSECVFRARLYVNHIWGKY